jgi:hypothetical protein
MRRALVLIVLCVPLLAAEGAAACSCLPPDRSTLRSADAAAVVRLLSVERLRDTDVYSSGDPAVYTYRVRRVIKGGLRRGRRIAVRSAISDATCGLSHRVGVLSGLFLDRRRGRWHSGSCWQTTPRNLRRIAAARSAAAGGGPSCRTAQTS